MSEAYFYPKKDEARAQKARDLRYKRSALKSMSYDDINTGLSEMAEVCDEVTYSMGDDWETIGNVIGDEDEANEFRMMFPDLSADIEKFMDGLYELENWYSGIGVEFNDCTVALLGPSAFRGRDDTVVMNLMGWDSYETDWYELTSYEAQLAETEAGKRLLKLTKNQLLEAISRAVRILIGYIDIRQRYDSLYAAMDIIRGGNRAQLKLIREIDKLYTEAEKLRFDWKEPATKHLDELIAKLPQRVFVE